VVNGGGPLLGVWATTTVRGVTPGHKYILDDGVAIDRMGRALTANALLGAFDTEAVSDALKVKYNQALPAGWSSFVPDLVATLAIYDGFDGQCGNQWLTARNVPLAHRYDKLAQLLADDRLWVNSDAHVCDEYLSVELKHPGARSRDCGGRTPRQDAVDVFRSLLVLGRINGVDDGVARDDLEPSDFRFPFLAPRTPAPQ
jgi:hypothetical protein